MVYFTLCFYIFYLQKVSHSNQTLGTHTFYSVNILINDYMYVELKMPGQFNAMT